MRLTRSAVCVMLLAGSALGACSANEQPEAPPLPRLAAAADQLSTSGVSAGGYMAGQLLVAHSKRFVGAGILAAGPYDCARGSLKRALGPCVSGAELDLEALRDATRTAATDEKIDPLENLTKARLWLFHGAADDKVGTPVVTAARDFYATWIPAESITLVQNIPAAHGLPTIDQGAPCNQFVAPYLNACDFDAAGKILSQMYGALRPAAESTAAPLTFAQGPFGGGLHDTGYVYIPTSCRKRAGCRIHVVLHGCQQSAEKIGAQFVAGAGYNRWAETNDIIVLYPQARSSTAPLNPLGCWDWWGYSGSDYANRESVQMQAILRMVDTLARPPQGKRS
ncbi:MAG: prolyl oligopeptidase family serine peptidase [Pseudomonadales bacterium]|nr:prolyl oligopeptidase family serine peptidase [Pseudomonadales bacterium]